MAVVTRYVNTASTAGGSGTTNATVGANRAYASLNEWEANEATTLDIDGDNHIVYCTGTAADTSSVIIGGWSMDYNGGNTCEIISSDGMDVTGYNTSLYRLDVTNSYTIYNNEDAVIVKNMQVNVTRSTAGASSCILCDSWGSSDADGVFDVQNCRISTSGSANSGYAVSVAAGFNTAQIWIRGNFITDFGNGGTYATRFNGGTGRVAQVYNNTIIGATGYHLWGQSGTCNAVNNISNDTTTAAFTGTWGGDYNCTDDTSGPGANAVDSTTVTFTNKANKDLTTTDSAVQGLGAGPSHGTYGSLVLTTDINGDTRSGTTCDIGADEYVAAGGGRAQINPLKGPMFMRSPV